MNTVYETNRLKLCVCRPEQAPLIAEFYKKNYEEFALYETLVEEAKTSFFHVRCLNYENKLFRRNKFLRLYVFEKHNPFRIIGTLSYREIRQSGNSCVLGYKMDKGYRRKGYCKEAILKGDEIMFKELGLSRINATVQPENTPSINLLLSIGYQNCGLMKEPLQVGEVFKEHLLFSLANDSGI